MRAALCNNSFYSSNKDIQINSASPSALSNISTRQWKKRGAVLPQENTFQDSICYF